ncbi:MAG: VTT domain-containing protein [Pseudomonadota bacterium]
MISDILLPIPATGIMAALGTVYGLWFGTLISVTGSVGAGLIGYGMARILGRNASRWIASEQEIQKFKDVFDRWGGYAIMASRAMPVMPEVMTILAGLGKMKFSRFIIALVAGSFPVAFFFSWMGACSGLPPGMGVMVAVLLPVLFWPILAKMNKI